MADYKVPSAYLEQEEKPIDYKYYFFLLKKNFYVIFVFFIIVVTMATLYVSKMPDEYKATTQVLIERPKIKYENQDTSMVTTETESYDQEYYNTQIQIMTNFAVLMQTVTDLKLANYFGVSSDEAMEKVKKMVKVEQVKTSRLFNLSVRCDNPKMAANIANSIARAYIRKNFEEQLYFSKEVLTWLPEKGDPTDMITITNPTGGAKQVTRAELIESLPSIKTDPTIRELKEKQAERDAELNLNLQRYREKHPIIVKNRANIKFIDESIQAEKKRIIDNLKAQAEGEHKVAAVRVIQEAKVPDKPEPSKRLPIVLIAGLAELILCFLLIAMFDHFDDTIHSFDDLERRGLTLPFLGPIPLLKKQRGADPSKRALASYYDKASGIAESFRYLRVAINFSATPEALKTLVITSCLPHEGKSFCAHNIAVSLAQDGNRTLLIDGDMRRPTLDRVFKLDNQTGLSNYLTSNIEYTSIFKETFIENLIAVTSGPMSPNPGEILASEKMKKFLEEMKTKFDRIIIDCPPLVGIGDGFVVGSMIGHVVLVISADKTPADLIRHTQGQIERAKIRLIGIILNMVDMEKERYRGYSKHYYHTYNRYYQVAEGGG